jgi:hypothetical protein
MSLKTMLKFIQAAQESNHTGRGWARHPGDDHYRTQIPLSGWTVLDMSAWYEQMSTTRIIDGMEWTRQGPYVLNSVHIQIMDGQNENAMSSKRILRVIGVENVAGKLEAAIDELLHKYTTDLKARAQALLEEVEEIERLRQEAPLRIAKEGDDEGPSEVG